MWGYGVDPPADINPHLGLVSRMSVGLELAFVAQVASSGLRSSQVLFDRSPTSGPSREGNWSGLFVCGMTVLG